MSKYLFLGAHSDDQELSCGGTIAKLIEQGNEIEMVALSHIFNNKSIAEELAQSARYLGAKRFWVNDFEVRLFSRDRQEILDYLVGINSINEYHFIFTHSLTDKHQDHKIVAEESIRAFKNKSLLAYQGEWNGNQRKNYFVKLEKRHIEKKIEALSFYKSQKDKPYMHPDFIYANAMNNGVVCGTKYAESFNAINLIQ